jgi:hypothetical protein
MNYFEFAQIPKGEDGIPGGGVGALVGAGLGYFQGLTPSAKKGLLTEKGMLLDRIT